MILKSRIRIKIFYEKYHSIDPDSSKPNEKFHEFAGEVIVASNLCQYGHLDSFALDSILKHNIEAHPETRMTQVKRILDSNKDDESTCKT